MRVATTKEVLTRLYESFTMGEIANMSIDQLLAESSEIEEEINSDRMQDEQDEFYYGNPDEDEYQMSESYYGDVQSEKYEWIKDA